MERNSFYFHCRQKEQSKLLRPNLFVATDSNIDVSISFVYCFAIKISNIKIAEIFRVTLTKPGVGIRSAVESVIEISTLH